MFLLYSLVGVLLANLLFIFTSFDETIRLNPLKLFPIGLFASMILSLSWLNLIQNLETKHMFLTTIIWNVGITTLGVLLPIFLYGVKLDARAIVGSVLAIVGVLLVHSGKVT